MAKNKSWRNHDNLVLEGKQKQVHNEVYSKYENRSTLQMFSRWIIYVKKCGREGVTRLFPTIHFESDDFKAMVADAIKSSNEEDPDYKSDSIYTQCGNSNDQATQKRVAISEAVDRTVQEKVVSTIQQNFRTNGGNDVQIWRRESFFTMDPFEKEIACTTGRSGMYACANNGTHIMTQREPDSPEPNFVYNYTCVA
jgi:hypothetical protein